MKIHIWVIDDKGSIKADNGKQFILNIQCVNMEDILAGFLPWLATKMAGGIVVNTTKY